MNLAPVLGDVALEGRVRWSADGWFVWGELLPVFNAARDGAALEQVLARAAATPGVARLVRPGEFAALGYPEYAESPYVPGQYLIAGDIKTHLTLDTRSSDTRRRLRARPYHGGRHSQQFWRRVTPATYTPVTRFVQSPDQPRGCLTVRRSALVGALPASAPEMKHRTLGLPLAILVLGAMPLITQLTAEVGSPQAQQPGKATAEQPEMVLTGCLRSGAADTSVAGPSGRLYTLEVTETVATTPPGSPTAAATGVPTKITYSLSAPESIGLAKHADQAVELTGRLQAPSTSANQSKTASAAGASSPKPGGAHRTFQVSALKAVPSRKCL